MPLSRISPRAILPLQPLVSPQLASALQLPNDAAAAPAATGAPVGVSAVPEAPHGGLTPGQSAESSVRPTEPPVLQSPVPTVQVMPAPALPAAAPVVPEAPFAIAVAPAAQAVVPQQQPAAQRPAQAAPTQATVPQQAAPVPAPQPVVVVPAHLAVASALMQPAASVPAPATQLLVRPLAPTAPAIAVAAPAITAAPAAAAQPHPLVPALPLATLQRPFDGPTAALQAPPQPPAVEAAAPAAAAPPPPRFQTFDVGDDDVYSEDDDFDEVERLIDSVQPQQPQAAGSAAAAPAGALRVPMAQPLTSVTRFLLPPPSPAAFITGLDLSNPVYAPLAPQFSPFFLTATRVVSRNNRLCCCWHKQRVLSKDIALCGTPQVRQRAQAAAAGGRPPKRPAAPAPRRWRCP